MSVTAVPLQPVKTRYKVWLWLGIVVTALAAFGLAWVGTREQVAARGTVDQYLAWNAGQPGVRTTESGLQYQLIKAGEGANAKDGDVPTISIEGRLRDGKVFQPRAGGPFPIQPGTAIPGFVEAMKLMNKGSSYRVWLPPKLGYDGVPGGGPPELKGQVLIFDIEMTELMTAAEMQMQQMLQQQMMQRQLESQGGGNESAPEDEAPKGR